MCFIFSKIVGKTWMWNTGVMHKFDKFVCIKKGTANNYTLKIKSNLRKAGVCIYMYIYMN